MAKGLEVLRCGQRVRNWMKQKRLDAKSVCTLNVARFEGLGHEGRNRIGEGAEQTGTG